MKSITTLRSTQNPDLFKKSIASLNRKARRLGVPEIEYEFKGQRKAPIQKRTILLDGSEAYEKNVTIECDVFDYNVSHVDVRQDGWTLVARISSMEDEIFVETFVDNVDRLAYKSLDASHCDHCKTNRNRSASWIIRHDDGREMQVGSTCLKELVGGLTASALSFASLVVQFLKVDFGGDLEEEGANGCREYCSTVEALAAVEAHIEVSGEAFRENRWAGMGTIIERGTHRHVAELIRNCNFPFQIVTDSHRRIAEQHIDVIAQAEGDSQFLDDLKYCLSQPYIPENKLGLVCYTHQVVKREIENREKKELDATRCYLGTVGKREDFDLICKKVVGYDTTYGYRYMNIFEDEHRNVLIWRTAAFIGNEGEHYQVKGTVSSHEPYRGTPQTVLKRCKIEKAATSIAA